MKVALCAIAKNEDNYVDEWIRYHLNIGVDHIFLNDNNDKDHPILTINDNRVTVIDVRGYKYIQNSTYTDCFNKYHDEYDWFIFIDLDEFIMLSDKYNNDIKKFLNEEFFKNVNIIRLNWKHFGDSELLESNGDYRVVDRFLKPIKHYKDIFAKSIISNRLNKNIKINCHGYYGVSAVDCEGNRCFNTSCNASKVPLYTNAWINHYATKTIEEYIRQKYFRGDATSKLLDNKYNLDHFFEYNERSIEKEEYAKKLISILSK